ncbi:unnamed protein product [Cylicocyclus nassatus]|uniref:Uncharacterized protein n=1 Tax=Cylicocyclus nassatus TaxID=53992 RepID=A0AA36GWR5_CYLNA|nr:unnamed protein product [Cylicocyclus nassatus]
MYIRAKKNASTGAGTRTLPKTTMKLFLLLVIFGMCAAWNPFRRRNTRRTTTTHEPLIDRQPHICVEGRCKMSHYRDDGSPDSPPGSEIYRDLKTCLDRCVDSSGRRTDRMYVCNHNSGRCLNVREAPVTFAGEKTYRSEQECLRACKRKPYYPH